MTDSVKKPVVVLQFGDGANDTRGRGEAYGMYDNGIWESVLGVQYTPNLGPRNRQGLATPEAHAAWLIDHKVDVVIFTMWMGAAPWLGRLKAMVPGLKVIALTDHPLNIDLLVSEPNNTARYMNAVEHADAMMVLTPREVSFYGGIHPNVHYVGLPFPHGAYERLRIERPAPMPKKEVTIGLSVGGPEWAWWDRNFLTTAFCYRLIARYQERHGVKVNGVWLSVTAKPESPHGKMMAALPGARIQQRTDMETYLHTLQSCDLVISNIIRDTPGRLVGEAAFFGVPCVGSDTLSLQTELFPALAHDPFDITATVQTSNILIERGVSQEVLDGAREGLRLYDYEYSRARFRQVMASIGLPQEWTTVQP